MNKIKYVISTKYGDVAEVSKEGYVIKYSNGLNKENANVSELKTWQILGIRELKPFNNYGVLIPLSEAVNIKEFRFKNRNPKYTVVDLDHNTMRIWGNIRYHGVVSIREK